MANIDEIFANPKVQLLMRRRKIRSTGIEAIRQGYSRYGQMFIMDFAEALKDQNFSSFDENDGSMTSEQQNSSFITTDQPVQNNNTGNGIFDWINNILNVANSVDTTIDNFKSNPIPSEPYNYEYGGYNRTWLYVVAGIALLVVILLIIKNK